MNASNSSTAATPATTTSTPETANAGAPEAPTPEKPTTPIQLIDVKLAQLIEQKPSFKTLTELGLAKLTELACESVDAQKRVKTASEKLRSTAKGVGKILAAMKVTYAQAQDAGTLSRDTSFEAYHDKVTGQKPWNHALQCAVVFAELVLTDRLTEKGYDDRSSDALQTASVILGANKKAGKDLNSAEVTELVDILLNSADDDRPKKLRQLKNRIQGKETTNEDGSGPALDLKNFDAILRRGCTMEFGGVHGLFHVACVLMEMVKSEKREPVLKIVYPKLDEAVNVCGTAEQQDAWRKETAAKSEPVSIAPPPSEPAAEKPAKAANKKTPMKQAA
jgi:hypothetical protein